MLDMRVFSLTQFLASVLSYEHLPVAMSRTVAAVPLRTTP